MKTTDGDKSRNCIPKVTWSGRRVAGACAWFYAFKLLNSPTWNLVFAWLPSRTRVSIRYTVVPRFYNSIECCVFCRKRIFVLWTLLVSLSSKVSLVNSGISRFYLYIFIFDFIEICWIIVIVFGWISSINHTDLRHVCIFLAWNQ